MSEGPSRFRSPPYPYTSLAKAIERAEQLYAKARNFVVPPATVAEAWNMKLTSSATLQTVAATIQYGLVADEGAKDARRFKLTDLGLHIVMDKRPGSSDRAEAIRHAALHPPIFRELWSEFGSANGVADSLLVHALTYERAKHNKAPYSEDSAKDVVKVYRDAIAFARLTDDQGATNEGGEAPAEQPSVNVGDLVQWAPGGTYALPEPGRVRFISPDGKWVFVEGSETGLPIGEIELFAGGLSPPAPTTSSGPPTKAQQAPPPSLPLEPQSAATSIAPDNIKLTIDGGRVLVSASVDLAGLRRLQKKLLAVEALLEDDG